MRTAPSPGQTPAAPTPATQTERRAYLIRRLLAEDERLRAASAPADEQEQRRLLRALLNVRPPAPADDAFLAVQDAYLREEIRTRGITDADALPADDEGLCLWQGDITTLRCDAIVNAANSGMTGCYVPNHRCIDNCIHTFAGVQLRLECARLMERQGHDEPTGGAKITPAYNLPCRHVLHTVGPIVRGAEPTRQNRDDLAGCYRSCLQLAARHGLRSVAFCCISTGEFRFPAEEAARIAVATVRECLHEKTSVRKVIFNVFTDKDRRIYESLLG